MNVLEMYGKKRASFSGNMSILPFLYAVEFISIYLRLFYLLVFNNASWFYYITLIGFGTQ
jgi:hypothetical protein